jgi:hypothetical protein
MIPVFPERAVPPLALIVVLSGPACCQLHAFADNILFIIDRQQVDAGHGPKINFRNRYFVYQYKNEGKKVGLKAKNRHF